MSQTKKTLPLFLLVFILFILGTGKLSSDNLTQKEETKNQIEKARIYQDTYPVISESDLYCSFFIIENESLKVRIINAIKEDEKILLDYADIIYFNREKEDGLEINQIFLIVEKGPKIKNLGFLGLKRGRARVIDLGETWGKAQVEKACDQVMLGHFLIPFEEKEDILEGRLGFEDSQKAEKDLKGHIVYLERDYQQIARDNWAIIDLGSEDGLHIGMKLNIFRILSKKFPPEAIGDLIVIGTQGKSATIKILSCQDVVKLGDLVQSK